MHREDAVNRCQTTMHAEMGSMTKHLIRGRKKMKQWRHASHLFLCLFILLLLSTAHALSVTERGILAREVEGNSRISFELEIKEVPQGYGVKITTDLKSPDMRPEGAERYEFKNNTLFIYPQIEELIVKISGDTPQSCFESMCRNLVFVDLNENEYLYYRVVAIDKTGAEHKEIGEWKRAFELKDPERIARVRENIESIEHKELREVARELFDVGLIDFANELANIKMEGGGVSLPIVIILIITFFLIGFFIGWLIFSGSPPL